MTDDDKIIERLTRLEEQVKSIPALLEVQIASLVARLEDVAQVITLHNETMANELKDTKRRVNKNSARLDVLEDRSEDTKDLRAVVMRYAIAGGVVLVGALIALVSWVQALP